MNKINMMNKRKLLKYHLILFLIAMPVMTFLLSCSSEKTEEKKPPNILLIMGDNQYYSDLGCYGNEILKTPNIDKVAKEGVRFTHAFCQSPSCSPARAAMLTGQNVWTLKEAADLWSSFPKDLKVYTSLLEKGGYNVGTWGKAWGPGNYKISGWKENPGGKHYNSFVEFYNQVKMGQPWFFWYSSRRPSRPFIKDGGKKAGINLDSIKVPPYLPNVPEVRADIADYYNEIQRFDREVGHMVTLLTETGQVDNTIIIVCSDNGWQMPRGLANLYDFGTRIPLIISWPGHFKGGREVDDFVLLNDLAPTFLDMAGIDIPDNMTAKSLLPELVSEKEGIIDNSRNSVILARERHAFCRQNGVGYPERAIRTKDYLYIKNYKPERWPAGDPPLYGDVDANNLQFPCPTKMYMLKNKNLQNIQPLFNLAFSKRPKVELYDLKKDPYQMKNVADDANYAGIKDKLSTKLISYLQKTGDPREGGPSFNFDTVRYFMDADKRPHPSEQAIKALNLKNEYNYIK